MSKLTIVKQSEPVGRQGEREGGGRNEGMKAGREGGRNEGDRSFHCVYIS